MKTPAVARLAALSVLAAVAVPAALAAQPVRPTVAVVGAGRVSVAPNIARLSISFVNRGDVSALVPTLVADNNARVQPALQYVNEVVGAQGTVTATPSIQQEFVYNRQSGEQELKGRKVVTTIEIELRGKEAIEQKLGKLFDSSRIQADNISSPALALSDRSHAAAKSRAYRLAAKNARLQAAAQLEHGERLGRAIDRGTGAGLSATRAKGMARMAAAMPESASDMGAGAPTVETGNIDVSASSQYVFEVLGAPARLKK